MQREDPAPEAPPRSQQAKEDPGRVGSLLSPVLRVPLEFLSDRNGSIHDFAYWLEVVLWEKKYTMPKGLLRLSFLS